MNHIQWEEGTQSPPDVKPKPCPICAGTGKKEPQHPYHWVEAGIGSTGHYTQIYESDGFLMSGNRGEARLIKDGSVVDHAKGDQYVDKVRHAVRSIPARVTVRVDKLIDMINGWGAVTIGLHPSGQYAVLYLHEGNDVNEETFAIEGDDYDQGVGVLVGLKINPPCQLADQLIIPRKVTGANGGGS